MSGSGSPDGVGLTVNAHDLHRQGAKYAKHAKHGDGMTGGTATANGLH